MSGGDPLTYGAVLGRTWRFGHIDGSILAPHMRLSHDGRIIGYTNSNEATWRLHEGHVELLDTQGLPTTRFDSITRTDSGTYELRGRHLGAAKDGAIHVLSEVPVGLLSPVQPPPRVAVMVRTHTITEKLNHILRRLSGGIGYDLFVCADETRSKIELPDVPVLGHSEAMCAGLGLMPALPGHRLLWYFGDYALYCGYASIPDYDYYVMIEYDLEFVRGNTLFLEGLINRLGSPGAAAYDFVGTQFGQRAPEWQWCETCAGVFPEVYGILFPMVILSRRALEYLYEWRKREAAAPPASGRPVYCEAFLPSALMAAGNFRCADVNTLLPGTWEFETFRTGSPMLLGSLPPLAQGVEIVHPVFSEREYLRAALEAARISGTLQAFLSKLAPGGTLTISAKARSEFMKETLRYLSLSAA
jgi:hypothetical protein